VQTHASQRREVTARISQSKRPLLS
jgi:hypothetical protein